MAGSGHYTRHLRHLRPGLDTCQSRILRLSRVMSGAPRQHRPDHKLAPTDPDILPTFTASASASAFVYSFPRDLLCVLILWRSTLLLASEAWGGWRSIRVPRIVDFARAINLDTRLWCQHGRSSAIVYLFYHHPGDVITTSLFRHLLLRYACVAVLNFGRIYGVRRIICA